MRFRVGAGIGICAIAATAELAVSPPVHADPAGHLSLTDYHWAGGAGIWSNSNQWRPTGVPGQFPMSDHVLIYRGQSTFATAHLDIDASIAALQVEAGDALMLDPGRTLTLNGGLPLDNAGLVHLADGDQTPTRIVLAGESDYHFIGGGKVVLAGKDAVIEGAGGGQWVINLDNTIEGFGRFGDDQMGLVNHALVVANVPFKCLTVNAGGGLQNFGIMGSTAGGWLRLIDTHVVNEDGFIEARHGSFVELDGSSIEGGRLTTQGSGVIRNMDHPVQWRDLVNLGRYMLGPSELWLQGTIRNDGYIDVVGDLTLASPEPTSRIRVFPDDAGSVWLKGSGTITLLSCEIHAGGPWEPAELINGEGHTIRGEGFFGAGDLAIVNDGVIIADGLNMLRLNPGVGRSLVNNGMLLCTGVAGAGVFSGSFYNHGTVDVRDGSRLLMIPGSVPENNAGGVLVGGTWRVEGHQLPTTLSLNGANILINAADVSLVGPASFFPRINSLSSNVGTFQLLEGQHFSTMSGFCNTGKLVIDTASMLHVSGTYKNKATGTFEVRVTDSQPQCALVCVEGEATISGTLRLVLNDSFPQGTVIALIAADAVVGTFTSIQAPAGITVQYTATGVTATIGSVIPTSVMP